MNRRRVLWGGAAAAMVMLLGGHTPYGQWVVYRKKHLLIGCHRGDPETYALAKRIEDVLAEHLPAARARVARAPHAGRLTSLLGTDQLEVAVIGTAEAAAMLQGSGDFAPYGAVALRLLLPLGGHALVARADFPDRHAWLVSGALLGTALTPASARPGAPTIPWHPGSRAVFEVAPQPATD